MFGWLFFWRKKRKYQPDRAADDEPTPHQSRVAPQKATRVDPPVLVRGDAWRNTTAGPKEGPVKVAGRPIAGIPLLIRRLTHKEADTRQSAADELGLYGSAAAEALPALVLAACDVIPAVRRTATEALGKIDPHWPADPRVWEVVPALIRELDRPSMEITLAAMGLIARIGEPAVPNVAESLATPRSDIQQTYLARVLGRVGPKAASATPALAATLESEHPHVREAAADALAQIGSAATTATPALIAALNDRLPGVRQACARTLAAVGQTAEAAIPALIGLFADREAGVREAAVDALARIGPTAVAPLVQVISARDADRMQEQLKQQQEVAEWRRQPLSDEALRELHKAAESVRWHFREAVEERLRVEAIHESAVRALGKLGGVASPAVGALIEATADESSRIRQAAVIALGGVGETATAAIAAVTRRLVDVNKGVRAAAVKSLPAVSLTWAERPEVPAVLMEIADGLKRTGDVGETAAAALVFAGASAVPVLVVALASDDRVVREAAATVLGKMGPAAISALPALERATSDSHGWVREAAAKAIAVIRTPSTG